MIQAQRPPIYHLLIAWVLLGPLLFFVARGAFSFDRAQYFNSQAADEGAVNESASDTTYLRLERFAMYALAMGAVATAFRNSLRALRRHAAVIALPILAIISALWSQDSAKTFVLGTLTLCLTLFAVYLTQRFQGERMVELMLFVGTAAALLSYLLIVFVPSAGVREFDSAGAWQGIFVHKNHCGMIMTSLFAAGLYVSPKSRLQRIGVGVYMLAVATLIIMTQSRTAWLLLAALASYYAFVGLYS